MTKPTIIYDQFDVVVVPFPFIDKAQTKTRPALVLSKAKDFNMRASAYVMSMITSSTHLAWPCDVKIVDLDAAGLSTPSIIRMKLFTLDRRLILKQLGTLSKKDQKQLTSQFKILFPL